MKTLPLLGAILVVLNAAITPMSGQTASASPAATVSTRSTPGGASSSPHPPVTATPSPSIGGQGNARVTPAATASPGGGAQLEGESPSATRESPLQAATPAERTKATPSKRHRKPERPEANTPHEGSGEQQ